jgi:transposase
MTATTRSTECSAPGATLMLAFELGSTKWTFGFTTAPAQRPRVRTMSAGDLPALEKEIQLAKMRFGLPVTAPVRSCYEAGRDGFWLHRWLIAHDVENVVVDSSSIEVNRRARRAKTDRLDVGKLLALLLRWLGGERKVWSVVHVPSPEVEAQRQLTREIATVREDRKRVRNRIQALLATQGIRLELRTGFSRSWPRCKPATAGRCRRRFGAGSPASGRTSTRSKRRVGGSSDARRGERVPPVRRSLS